MKRQGQVFESLFADALRSTGVAAPDIIETQILLGRNLNGIVTLRSGDQYFVKQIVGSDANTRMNRSESIYDVIAGNGHQSSPRIPQLRGTHTSSATMVFERAPIDTSFGESVRVGNVTPNRLKLVAAAVAQVHSLRVPLGVSLDTSRPRLPPHGLNAISADEFFSSTIGELEMWQRIQSDQELLIRLDQLVVNECPSHLAPIHADMRADQVSIDGSGTVWMHDWEEFRLGDPARDVGAIMGEIVYHHCRQALITQAATGNLDAESTTATLASGLAAIAPVIREFLAAYSVSLVTGVHDAHLAVRATGYLGWQMFERAIAAGTYVGRVSVLDRMLAGIGREAILHSEDYAGVFGIASSPKNDENGHGRA